ncbi:MAG: ATP-binding protein [Candidatus Eisenbacteria bacterium]
MIANRLRRLSRLKTLRLRLALWSILIAVLMFVMHWRILQSGPGPMRLFMVLSAVGVMVATVGGTALLVYRVMEQPLRTLREQSRTQMVHQEKMAALGLLASGVAHEIGNPLTAVSSVAQLLRHRSQDPGVQKQLDLILTHLDRISKIVREMSDFSRPPSLVAAPTDVNEVLKTALHLARYDRRSRDVTVQEDLASHLPRVTLVADHLFQVFLNLILNALDAMQKGGRLTLRSRTVGEEIAVEVEDQGTGIAPELLDRIFDPFFTTKPVGKGTGLGLSVSYGIINSLGGRIDVESEPSRGSTFTVWIPVKSQLPAPVTREN